MMTKFKGFDATTTKGTPCYVLNDGELTDGTPAYKVRMGSLGGFEGWSGGAHRDVSYSGSIGWIAKSKITKGKAR